MANSSACYCSAPFLNPLFRLSLADAKVYGDPKNYEAQYITSKSENCESICP